jgi:hypothetical protein
MLRLEPTRFSLPVLAPELLLPLELLPELALLLPALAWLPLLAQLAFSAQLLFSPQAWQPALPLELLLLAWLLALPQP